MGVGLGVDFCGGLGLGDGCPLSCIFVCVGGSQRKGFCRPYSPLSFGLGLEIYFLLFGKGAVPVLHISVRSVHGTFPSHL